MFGVHIFESEIAVHKIEDEKWEEILEKIFSKVVNRHKSCLCLISNTHRDTIDDKIGKYSEVTQFLFKKKISQKKHDLLKLIDKDQFNSIFEEYLSYEEEDRDDFYHLKEKYKIGVQILVYPFFDKLEKKALLMLDYPTDRIILDRICNEILNVVSARK